MIPIDDIRKALENAGMYMDYRHTLSAAIDELERLRAEVQEQREAFDIAMKTPGFKGMAEESEKRLAWKMVEHENAETQKAEARAEAAEKERDHFKANSQYWATRAEEAEKARDAQLQVWTEALDAIDAQEARAHEYRRELESCCERERGNFEEVEVLRERAARAEAALRDLGSFWGEIEERSSDAHDVYQKEAHRRGDVRHADAYADLPEATKEWDRVLVRWVFGTIRDAFLFHENKEADK